MNLTRLADLGTQLQKVAGMAEGPDDVSERAGLVQAEMRRVTSVLLHRTGPDAVRACELLWRADVLLTKHSTWETRTG